MNVNYKEFPTTWDMLYINNICIHDHTFIYVISPEAGVIEGAT